jgi:hypothetical protein
MNFNYEKAYFVIAKPAFLNLTHKQRNVHSRLIPIIGELDQGRDLNIPMSPAIKATLEELTCLELAELSRASNAVIHWKPSDTEDLFIHSKGEGWKISNVCDQVLRKRLLVGTNRIEIHEGILRRTLSSERYWHWEEFGLATEENLVKYSEFDLAFDPDSITSNLSKLKDSIGDMWPDVETLSDNLEYVQYLVRKTEIISARGKELAEKNLEKAEDELRIAKVKYDGYKWLYDNGVSHYNVIFYSHLETFSFGWGSLLTEVEKEELTKKLTNFPFKYELKSKETK